MTVRASAGGRRLCIVAHAPYPVGEPRAERAAKAAHDAGYRVTVIALRTPGESARESVDGIAIRRLPVSHARGVGLPRMLLERLSFLLLASTALAGQCLRARVDLVEVHAPPEPLVVAGLVPRLLGARVVLDIRDLSSHLFMARFGARRGARVIERCLRAIERASAALADRVVTVHEPYRGELEARGVPTARVEVVMNSPDEALVGLARGAAASTCEDAFTVAYHGTITGWYGVDVLVRAVAAAAKDIPHLRAVVLGEGDALAEVRGLADSLGVADRVEFSGRYLPIEEALTRVARTDCGVIPNKPATTLNQFILPNKLFEYVFLNIPVVVARLRTMGEHFSDDEVTFFEPDDPDSLAEAMRWVAQNRQAARAKADRAARHARTEYSWPANRRRYIALLNETHSREDAHAGRGAELVR